MLRELQEAVAANLLARVEFAQLSCFYFVSAPNGWNVVDVRFVQNVYLNGQYSEVRWWRRLRSWAMSEQGSQW